MPHILCDLLADERQNKTTASHGKQTKFRRAWLDAWAKRKDAQTIGKTTNTAHENSHVDHLCLRPIPSSILVVHCHWKPYCKTCTKERWYIACYRFSIPILYSNSAFNPLFSVRLEDADISKKLSSSVYWTKTRLFKGIKFS